MIWFLISLWSGTKAFFLDGLFRVDLKSYGWAGEYPAILPDDTRLCIVVTGASDGIGKEYALQVSAAAGH